MTNEERIEQYTAAAVRATGQPVRKVIVQKGKVEIIMDDKDDNSGEGLRKDWT